MAEPPRGHLLLVGTATGAGSKGIYAYLFDSSTGELTQTGLATEADNPTFLALAPDKRTVFVANEINHYEGKRSGAVSSYTLDRAKAQLTKVNESATGGGGTCYVSTDHTGRCVFGANYGGGSATSFAASPDGRLSEAVSFFQYTGHGPNAERQEGPHAHRVTVSPDNRFLLVNDLGLDVIHIYRLDAATAKLTPNEPAVWKSAPGSGPRALRFHPNGRIAYCVTEMGSSVVVLRWDAKEGTFQAVQEVVIKPADYQGETRGADIVIDRGAVRVCDRPLRRYCGQPFDLPWGREAYFVEPRFVRGKNTSRSFARSEWTVAAGGQSGLGQHLRTENRCAEWKGRRDW
jgi:6-phosphogluconolactonase